MKNLCRNARTQCTLWLSLAVCSVPIAWAGQITGAYQHGTVVRMQMSDCILSHHGFMSALSGPAAQIPVDACPEYTLVSDKVVFVIVGKSSDQLVPLADSIDFRVHNHELAVRVDDARHESRFSIKEMILRSQWDLVQSHIEDQLKTPPSAAGTPAAPASAPMAVRQAPAPIR